MSFLRHSHIPFAAALLAALAVLFVATASMACEAPVDQGMAPMAMHDDGGPCDHEVVKVSCQKACLVFCQSLIPLAVAPGLARDYAAVRYPPLDARYAGLTLEADDPPPRP